MRDVLCHMTGYDVDLPDGDRHVLIHYAYRSLLLAGEDDDVVLPGLHKPEELIAILNLLELGPDPGRVYSDLTGLRGRRLEPFSGATPRLWETADLAGCTLACPPLHICVQANNKGWFQRRFAHLPEAHLPDGDVCSGFELASRAQTLMKRHGRSVRVKAVSSTSGLKQIVLHPNKPFQIPGGAYVGDRFVVQVEMRRDADASVQFQVSEGGEITIGPAIAQHIRGEGNHGGNYYPAHMDLGVQPSVPASTVHEMYRAAAVIAEGLRELGYFGPASADFVVDLHEERAWAVEVNARVTAPRYLLRAAQSWYGAGTLLPFDSRSFRFRKGWSPKELAAHFNGLLFDRGRRMGFIPFTIIPYYGVCVGVAFAPTVQELTDLVIEVEARKSTLL